MTSSLLPSDPAAAATLALLRQWVDDDGCLGVQVFAWQDGQVRVDLAVGRAGPSRPASGSDIGRLYCAVKPIAACCLARAVQAGEASFDDPVSRFLPAFAPGGKTAITLRQLLSHTSGMSDVYLDPYEHGFDKLVSIACTWQLPADTWFREPRYNDLLAWDVIAAVVQEIYGHGFADTVTETITGPLGLTDLRMTGPDPARYQQCYKVGRSGFSVVPEPAQEVLFGSVNPANGGFGTARDLGLFYAELVRCAHGEGTLLDARTVQEITRPHGRVDFGLSLGERSYGLGFLTDVCADGIGGRWSPRSFGHAGYVGRYQVVHAFADPEHRAAVAIRLFSVGAKNHWRFHRLGWALWSDLGLGPSRQGPPGVRDE